MHQPSKLPPIEPTELQHYTQICIYDRFLVFDSGVKSLLTLACFFLDLNSSAETHPSGDGSPQVQLVVAPGNSLGEPTIQSDVLSLAELELKAGSFISAIGDFQPPKPAKPKDTETQNGSHGTGSIEIQSNRGPFDLRVITESRKGQTAIIVSESQRKIIHQDLLAIDQASISIFRIPDSLMGNGAT